MLTTIVLYKVLITRSTIQYLYSVVVSIWGKVFFNDSNPSFPLPCHDPFRTTSVTLYKIINDFCIHFLIYKLGLFQFSIPDSYLISFNDGVFEFGFMKFEKFLLYLTNFHDNTSTFLFVFLILQNSNWQMIFTLALNVT